MNKMKFTARNDYAFKKLFGSEENRNLLQEFLTLTTDLNPKDVADLNVEDSELSGEFYGDKYGYVDIKVQLKDGQKINIEMQNLFFENYTARSLFYRSKLFLEDFAQGEDYGSLNRCISINIVNKPSDLSTGLQSVFHLWEDESHTLMSNLLEMRFYDLTKIPEKNRTKLENWLLFIQTDEQEVRKMLADENPLLLQGISTLDSFFLSKEERALYWAARKRDHDQGLLGGTQETSE